MGKPPKRYGIPQRLGDGFLSDDLFKSPGTPLSV